MTIHSERSFGRAEAEALLERELGIPGASVVATPSFLLAMENLTDVFDMREMTLLVGPTGCGKTIAALVAGVELVGGCFVYLRTPPSPNPRIVANCLVQRATGIDPDATRWPAARLLMRELVRDGFTLIIDEAQNLDIECIEYLRWLHEELENRFALVLVGGSQCGPRLKKNPQLWRRIYQPTPFAPLPDEVLVPTIRAWHPIYEKATKKQIQKWNALACGGTLGEWERITKVAQRLCRRAHVERVTDEIMDTAIRRNKLALAA